MEEATRAAGGDIVLFLDDHAAGLQTASIPRLTEPIVQCWADLVKAKSSQRADYVTELTVRPLLAMFFPELAAFDSPLHGPIAVRRSLLETLRFETDYGVDVGLLIDACAEAQVAEVDVGWHEHHERPAATLGELATQVTRTILDRAARYGRLHPRQLCEIQEVQRYTELALASGPLTQSAARELALFDMDETILRGRFLLHLAQRTARVGEVSRVLDDSDLSLDDRAQRIAAIFAGLSRTAIEEAAHAAPLTPGARETVLTLRRAGFQVGILTDSYSIAAEIIRRRVLADFSIGHHLTFHNGRATGKLTFSPAMFHTNGCRHHSNCKQNAMLHLMERFDIGPEHVLAVGNSQSDICLLKAAGRSMSLNAATAQVREAAKCVVCGDLTEVAAMVQD
jgi:glucosyl-3-phosphoglycerate synthase